MPPDTNADAVEGKTVGPVRFRAVDGRYVLTTDWGAWAVVSAADFSALMSGELDPKGEAHATLEPKGFVKGSRAASFEVAAPRLDRRRDSVGWGPHTHVLNVTRSPRGGQTAGADDMSVETAERCVDLVFRSTSPRLRVVFQGPHALRSHAAIERVVAQAERWNEDVQKRLSFELWSDLEGLDDERLAWLVEHRFAVYAPMGPDALADEGAPVRARLRRLVDAYEAAAQDGEAPGVGAVVPCTKAVLGLAAAIVKACLACGCDELVLRPPAPEPLRADDGEAPELGAWLAFYGEALDAVLAANVAGATLVERGARLLAQRILGEGDPHRVELRSPAADGIGQLSYAPDGSVLASDAGRLLYERGDATFRLGVVGEDGYRDMLGHPTVRALAVASMLEGQPGCTDCAYLPFCGQSPAHNYCEQGSIQGRMADSSWCARMMGLWDLLFRKLQDAEPAQRELLASWGRTDAGTR